MFTVIAIVIACVIIYAVTAKSEKPFPRAKDYPHTQQPITEVVPVDQHPQDPTTPVA